MVWRRIVCVDDVHAVFSGRAPSRIWMGAYAYIKNKNQEPGFTSGNDSVRISFTYYGAVYHMAGANLAGEPL